MTYGDQAQNLIDAHREAGMDPPDHLYEPPLPIAGGFYIGAFLDLLPDKREGRIPFTALDAYGRRFGIRDPDAFRLFMDAIRALENQHAALLKTLNPPKEPS